MIRKSIDLILKNEPLIVPTDTVYGLVCRYDSRKAVEKIYKLKKRNKKKPLILLGYNWKVLKKFISVGALHATPLQGSLTLVLPASKHVPKFLNKGFKTIGVRIPNNKFLLDLLKHCPEQVLASTSANISGKPSKQPQKELIKKVKLFIKAKRSEMSFKPSRILEITKSGITVLR